MLRQHLLYKNNEALADELLELIQTIQRSLEHGHDTGPLIAQFSRLAGNNKYDRTFFETLHKHSSPHQAAKEIAACKDVAPVPDITRDELVSIIELARTVDEPAASYYRELFDKNVPMPGGSNLLFYPPNHNAHESLKSYNPSAEQIVDWATDQSNIIQL